MADKVKITLPGRSIMDVIFCKDLTPTPLQGRGNWKGEFYNLKTLNLMTLLHGVGMVTTFASARR
jgi:hypothetical protein